jgi:nucleotide-binding universal stress UspA family protein
VIHIAVTHVIVAVVALFAGMGLAALLARWRRQAIAPPARRVLLPFAGKHLSERVLDAALRLAHAEGATIVPVYLAPVPMALVLEAPLPRTCGQAFSVFDAIELRAARCDVPVDPRIERGRTIRHALRTALDEEHYDRLVLPAGTDGTDGFSADDVAWVLRHARGEVVVLKPADEQQLAVAA